MHGARPTQKHFRVRALGAPDLAGTGCVTNGTAARRALEQLLRE
jgi:hypothetical protein